jgi:serine/threonine protein kinase
MDILTPLRARNLLSLSRPQVVHRDLKPENIMYATEDEDSP